MHILVTNDAINIGEDILCRSPTVACWLLSTGEFTHLYISEELGEDADGTPRSSGLDVLKWAQTNGVLPAFVQVIKEEKERNLSTFLFENNRNYEKGFWTEAKNPVDVE